MTNAKQYDMPDSKQDKKRIQLLEDTLGKVRFCLSHMKDMTLLASTHNPLYNLVLQLFGKDIEAINNLMQKIGVEQPTDFDQETKTWADQANINRIRVFREEGQDHAHSYFALTNVPMRIEMVDEEEVIVYQAFPLNQRQAIKKTHIDPDIFAQLQQDRRVYGNVVGEIKTEQELSDTGPTETLVSTKWEIISL